MEQKYYIYTLTDPIDKEIKYIGKSKNMKNRLWNHMSPYSLKESWTPKNKWLLYLRNNNLKPIMEVLDEGNENNIDLLEEYWIGQFKAWGFKLKNVAGGGKGCSYWTGKKIPEYSKLKTKMNNPYRRVVCQYEIETNKLLGEYVSINEAGRKTGVREDHVSKCCKNIENTAGGFYFRFKDNYFPFVKTIVKQSEESKLKSKMNHPFRKVICQYEIETDKLIKEWDSSHDIEREIKISRNHVCKCCKGIENYNTAGGYYWRFKDNYFKLKESPETIGKFNKNYKK